MKKLQNLGACDEDSTQEEKLKSVIRLTYTVFFWVCVILATTTITKYFLWKWVGIAQDIGIIIALIWLWRIRRRMKKKQKEEEVKQ